MSRRRREVALLAGLSLLAVSCGGGDGVDADSGAAAGSPASAQSAGPAAADERLPEGTYETRPIAPAEFVATAVAAGFDPARVEQHLTAPGGTGPATSVVVTVRLAQGRWVLFQSFDGGADEIGWSGTYEVVDDDTVVATDPCGAITYDYALDGDVLTLRMVDDQCQGNAGDDPFGELIAQTTLYGTAPFTKVA